MYLKCWYYIKVNLHEAEKVARDFLRAYACSIEENYF